MIKIATLLFISFLLFQNAGAQSVNDIPLKELKADYLQMTSTPKSFSNKINVLLEYGQESKAFDNDKNKKLRDGNGKEVAFNSMMDAVNFMSTNGFDVVQVFMMGSEQCYLLKKRK